MSLDENKQNFKDNNPLEPIEEENNDGIGDIFSFVLEMVKVTLIALAIILPVRYFLIKPFYVNGASMEPTYYNKEYLIIDEISYRFNDPVRGEVVVFRYPRERTQFFIKRIIGLPGERIVISSGVVTIYNNLFPNGITIREPYLESGETTAGNFDISLGEDEYFVLGDNRSASLDSRRFGALPRKEIVGKAWFRGWPIGRVGIISHYLFDF